MQAIARVNRVFKDKPGGLVVDYLGLAQELKEGAGRLYRERRRGRDDDRPGAGGRGNDEKYEVVLRLFHGFNWSKWASGTPERGWPAPAAQEHILKLEEEEPAA